MSIFAVVGIVFIILKLVGTIAWSWWLVLLPFYMIPAIIGVPFVFLGLLRLGLTLIEASSIRVNKTFKRK